MIENNSAVVEYSAEWWCNELASTGKTLDDKWRRSARKVISRYLDDRSELEPTNLMDSRKYNIFWANVQIMKSALYATPPRPEVKRQHDDAKDDVARTAALILERMLNFDLHADGSSDHTAIQQAVEDRLIPGLGQIWLRYDVETEKYMTDPVVDEFGTVLVESQEAERLVNQQIFMDFVHWDDFYWSPARTWQEVHWVSRRVWLTKGKFIRRFGQKLYDEIKKDLQDISEGDIYPKGFEKGRVEVFEIWCEETKKAYWIHRGTKKTLDQKDDPYSLPDFFPCPCPLLATHSNNSLIPRPDYVMVQDQYEELDVLNSRIYALTKALRVVGVYDSSSKAEMSSLLTGSELRMIPVDDWAMFAEKGGLKGVVDWFPVEQVQKVLAGLMEQRQSCIQQIYELTSISDIMRGVSQARETAKAQTLKAQYSSVRLQLSQQAVGKFVCDLLRIKASMISNLFDPQIIGEQSQIEATESAQFAQPAIELIKNGAAMKFRIKVGEQSMSMADYNAEREMRVEFITAMGQFLSQAATMVQSTPQALPYLLRMLAWVAASFRGADDIESVLDEAIGAAANMPEQPQGEEGKSPAPPPPDPQVVEQARAQGQIAVNKAKTQDQAVLNAQLFRFKSAEKVMDAILNPPSAPNANL